MIWGNHSNTQFPDWTNALDRGQVVPSTSIGDRRLARRRPSSRTVQERGKAIIEARGVIFRDVGRGRGRSTTRRALFSAVDADGPRLAVRVVGRQRLRHAGRHHHARSPARPTATATTRIVGGRRTRRLCARADRAFDRTNSSRNARPSKHLLTCCIAWRRSRCGPTSLIAAAGAAMGFINNLAGRGRPDRPRRAFDLVGRDCRPDHGERHPCARLRQSSP